MVCEVDLRSEAGRLVGPLQEPMRDRGDASRGGSCGGDRKGVQLNEVRVSVAGFYFRGTGAGESPRAVRAKEGARHLPFQPRKGREGSGWDSLRTSGAETSEA